MRACKTCAGPIHRRNRSGLCKRCIVTDPAMIAKKAAATRRYYQTHPEALEAKTRQLVAQTQKPEHGARARRMVMENRLWEQGHASYVAGSEAARRGGARLSAVRLAWCPPELRDEYRFLTNAKGYRAAEARAMIEDQHELQMACFRRALGVVEAVEGSCDLELEPEQDPDAQPSDQALGLAARRFETTVLDIMSSSRRREHVVPRYALAAAMRRNCMSYPEIARTLGASDHSSSMHWRAQGEARAASDRKFARIVDELTACWPTLEAAA